MNRHKEKTVIKYVKGDAARPLEYGHDYPNGPLAILHVCNNQGGWGKGFSGALSKQYPEAEIEYRSQWAEDGPGLKLGEVQLVSIGAASWIANMVAQDGYRRPGNLVPLNYKSLENCLLFVANFFKSQTGSLSFHMPRIGCGLGGGTWEDVEPVIQRTLVASGFNVTVYDP